MEFDGLRARECMTLAGLSEMQPIYSSASKENNVQRLFSIIMDNEGQAPIRLIGLAMVLLDEIVQTSKTKISTKTKRVRDFYMKEAIEYRNLHYFHTEK